MNFKVNDILERVTEDATYPKYVKIIVESNYHLNMKLIYLVNYFGKHKFINPFWLDDISIQYYKKCENKIVEVLYG